MTKLTQNRSRLRDLSSDELRDSLTTTRDDLFRIKLGMHTNQVASTAELRNKRREVARILTILRARELELETQGAGKGA